MKLILARHGNTFGPEDTPVWVGAQEDYPLVETGLHQAHDIADALIRRELFPDVIIAGPLQRTRVGAAIIAEDTDFPSDVIIDERLMEIDYGSWGGKSDDEIIARHGEGVIHDWRERSIRPEGADWSPSENELLDNALSVLKEIKANYDGQSNVLLVTSNGILRFYHALLYAEQNNPPPGKVKTGHLCLADFTDGVFEPKCWNVSPQDF